MSKTNKKTGAIFGAAAIIALVVAFSIFNSWSNIDVDNVKAASADNILGSAWSESFGWISFNSVNCDNNGNGFIDAGDCGGDDATTPIVDYGVNVNFGAGNLSGVAWSENAGWISFNWPDIGDGGMSCPSDATGATCQPRYDSVNNEFLGWARACSVFQTGCSGALKPNSARGGWDGWISLNCSNGDVCGASDYKVSLSGADFAGEAWGGDITTGWISFNSANCDNALPLGQSDGGAGCPPAGTPMASYKVYLAGGGNAPTVTLNNPNWGSYCKKTPASAIFSWNYSDPDNIPPGADPQSGYQVKLTRSDSATCGTGYQAGQNSSITGSAISDAGGFCPGFLDYSYTYVWEVQVWDSAGTGSGFVSSDPINNFIPPIHAYPSVDITSVSFVGSPVLGKIRFDYSTQSFGGNNLVKLEWDFGDGSGIETDILPLGISSITSSKIHTYSLKGNYTATLTVYDDTPPAPPGFDCFDTASVNISTIRWKEVTPAN